MTNEDRELLELAAKAIGLNYTDAFHALNEVSEMAHISAYWNPLTSRADANALQEKLRMNVFWDGDEWTAYNVEHGGNSYDPDMNRAITLCAAEIGRRMG